MFVVSTMWLDSESACRCVIIVSYLLRMPLTERDRHSFFLLPCSVTCFCNHYQAFLATQSLQHLMNIMSLDAEPSQKSALLKNKVRKTSCLEHRACVNTGLKRGAAVSSRMTDLIAWPREVAGKDD